MIYCMSSIHKGVNDMLANSFEFKSMKYIKIFIPYVLIFVIWLTASTSLFHVIDSWCIILPVGLELIHASIFLVFAESFLALCWFIISINYTSYLIWMFVFLGVVLIQNEYLKDKFYCPTIKHINNVDEVPFSKNRFYLNTTSNVVLGT